MTWLIFCAVKFQVSKFDESSQLPRARNWLLVTECKTWNWVMDMSPLSVKLYILIKIHLTWTCILVLDLYAAFTFASAWRARRHLSLQHEQRAAAALQSGGRRRPERLVGRPAVGRAAADRAGDGSFARRGGSPPTRRPARRAARPAAAWRGERPSPRASRSPGVPLPWRPAPRAFRSPGVLLPGRPAPLASRSPGVPLPGRSAPRAYLSPGVPLE
jgi:hypothetical protein